MGTLATAVAIVLGLVTNSVARLIARVTTIVNAMAANKGTFPTPNPALATISAAVVTLSNAEAAYKAHLGIRADRDNAQKALVELMHQLHAYVQALAAANPSQAETIAQNAAMTLRKTATRHKSDLAVKPTVSGSSHLVAKAAKGNRAHEWEYSADGGKTWIATPSTTKASTTITGLQPGTLVSYRHRPITKAGPGDWSQVVTAIVT